MKLGLVIYSNDSETVWNAFRFGVYALKRGDSVAAFLLAKGVEADSLDTDAFKVADMMRSFLDGGGKISACGTCLKIRHSGGSELCPVSTMQDLHDLVRESERVITF